MFIHFNLQVNDLLLHFYEASAKRRVTHTFAGCLLGSRPEQQGVRDRVKGRVQAPARTSRVEVEPLGRWDPADRVAENPMQ